MYGCTGKANNYHTWILCDLVLNFVVLCGLSTHLRSVDLIVSVQHRAAWWIKSSFDPLTLQWTKSSDECIRELGWPSLELQCNYACIVMLYAMLNNLTPITFSEYYWLNKLSTRSHPMMIYPIPYYINSYHYSFLWILHFWNSITYDVLSAPQTFIKYKLKQFLFWL